MRATAQDPEAARMMGVEVDRVVLNRLLPWLRAGRASGLIFGLYYNFTSFLVGFRRRAARLYRRRAGRHWHVTGAMVGGIIIGLIEA